MNRIWLSWGLAVLTAVAGSGLAIAAEPLTKDEAFLTAATRLEVLDNLYARTRKASVAGQRKVVSELVMRMTDSDGQVLAAADLSPVLSNLQADLRDTDMLGEFRAAGFRVLSNNSGTLAPRFIVVVASSPAVNGPRLKTRKMYSVFGIVTQVMTVGMGIFGKREAVVTGAYSPPPIIATADERDDAENIRVAVRSVVDQYISEAGVSVHQHRIHHSF